MFSERKIQDWDKERVLRFLAKAARKCEQAWSDLEARQTSLKQMRQLVEICGDRCPEDLKREVRKELDRYEFTTLLGKLEQVADLTTPDILKVRKGDSSDRYENIPLTVVVHNLRSAFNVGSIFRTAECMGAEQIILTGCSPTPEQNQLKKSAMGTDEHIKWCHQESLHDTIKGLKDQGISIVALETVEDAPMFNDFSFPKPCALLLGNEKLGIPEDILSEVDYVVQIPVYGWKNSLNVGVAFALCAFEIGRQLRSE